MRGLLGLGLFALTVVLVWTTATEARACRPSWEHRPISTPFVDTPGLALAEPSVALECSASRRATTCRLRARYELVNAGSESWVGHAAVFWDPGTSLVTSFAGERGAGVPAELQTRAAVQMLGESATANEIAGAGRELRIEPGGSVVIEVEGQLSPARFDPPCQMVQIQRRHMLVNRDSGRNHIVEIMGDPELPSATAGEVRLRVPGWWGAARPRRRGWHTTSLTTPRTFIDFERRPRIYAGGPIVAVGVDVRDRPQLKLRAGYEIAVPKFLIWSLAVESDAKSHVEIVPTVELTFPVWSYMAVWLPAPAIGLGVPVQVYPFARPGVRTHAGLHWHVAGIIGFFDAYPAMRGRSRELVGGVALQLGI